MLIPLYKTCDYIVDEMKSVEAEIAIQENAGWKLQGRSVERKQQGDRPLCTLTFKWVGLGDKAFPCIICKSPQPLPTNPVFTIMIQGVICERCTKALKSVIENEQSKQQS